MENTSFEDLIHSVSVKSTAIGLNKLDLGFTDWLSFAPNLTLRVDRLNPQAQASVYVHVHVSSYEVETKRREENIKQYDEHEHRFR